MQIQDLELKIFNSLDELKNVIKQNFNVEEMELLDHTDIDFEIDDELAFCDGEYDYSVYYMTGKSGRIIVVETSKQTY
jgi:hypothetical protein